jgi:hypothetical protein
VSPEEAVKVVKSGDTVVIPIDTEPHALSKALMSRRAELKNVTIMVRQPRHDLGWFEADFGESFRVILDTQAGVGSKALNEKRVDYIPFLTSLRFKDEHSSRRKVREIDVVMLVVSGVGLLTAGILGLVGVILIAIVLPFLAPLLIVIVPAFIVCVETQHASKLRTADGPKGGRYAFVRVPVVPALAHRFNLFADTIQNIWASGSTQMSTVFDFDELKQQPFALNDRNIDKIRSCSSYMGTRYRLFLIGLSHRQRRD